MDPDANLEEQRRLAARITDAIDGAEEHDGELRDVGALNDIADAANRLAELVTALDQWIARGGALPKAWQRVPTPMEAVERTLTELPAAEAARYACPWARSTEAHRAQRVRFERRGEAVVCGFCGTAATRLP